ncbi:MAG: GNAT family N-acetyltransferase [Pseudomonadota bacterium]
MLDYQPALSNGSPETAVEQQGDTTEFELARTRADFLDLEEDWNALFATSARSIHVFQSFNWLWHWSETYGRNNHDDFVVVTARRNGQLILVWPMHVSRRLGVTRLEWLGEPIGQYGDLIVADISDRDCLIRNAWQHAVADIKPDAVHLRRVRSDANVHDFLSRNAAILTEQRQAPYVATQSANTFPEYSETRLSNRSRRNRRRLRRRLHERGEIRSEILSPSEQAADIAVEAIQLKRAWIKDRGLASPALESSCALAFFRAVCSGGPRPVEASVHALYCDQDLANAQIYFSCKRRSCLHIIVYALDYEKTRCGLLHCDDAVENAFETDTEILDFLPPDSDYKRDWASGSVAVSDFALPLTLKGYAYVHAYVRTARPLAKALIQKLPWSWCQRLPGANGHEPE